MCTNTINSSHVAMPISFYTMDIRSDSSFRYFIRNVHWRMCNVVIHYCYNSGGWQIFNAIEMRQMMRQLEFAEYRN